MDLSTPLTANWRHLLFLNYEIDPELVSPYLPHHTELDLWKGKLYLSLVGLMFLDSKIYGIPDPLHQSYEQVNLRFYVRHRVDNGWHQGVVFIKEIVPSALVTAAARIFMGERYVTMPMRHRLEEETGALRVGSTIEYEWQPRERWNSATALVKGMPERPEEESRELFVMHRLFGYNKRPDGGTTEYRLSHPVWDLQRVADPRLACDVAELYGDAFVPYLTVPPAFAFIASGSDISMEETRSL